MRGEAMALSNFSWLIEGKLAGSARPGGDGPEEDDLRFLQEQGIRAIVTLCHQSANPVLLEKYNLMYKHLPVEDFEAPSFELIDKAVGYIERRIANNQPVLVHCRAGYGRTGTILACYLVKRGMSPSQALAEVRRARPGSVEVKSQERAVLAYYRKLHSHPEFLEEPVQLPTKG
ncbi:MAG TPA: dual specificity protein phosphatase 23 [Chloroflexia bacterium]|nr:dual specificity protein phosphatase 23 [Chloroflexia bacterium]